VAVVVGVVVQVGVQEVVVVRMVVAVLGCVCVCKRLVCGRQHPQDDTVLPAHEKTVRLDKHH